MGRRSQWMVYGAAPSSRIQYEWVATTSGKPFRMEGGTLPGYWSCCHHEWIDHCAPTASSPDKHQKRQLAPKSQSNIFIEIMTTPFNSNCSRLLGAEFPQDPGIGSHPKTIAKTCPKRVVSDIFPSFVGWGT